jgi:nucleotide-binding universal stress UspA family protein
MRLLLPTDFSPASARGEAEGARLARSLDADVIVLHVVQELHMYGRGRVKIADLLALRAARLAAAKRDVRSRITTIRSRGLRARGVVQSGSADRQIVATARRRRCTMIVMATRGRGHVARWLLGSTTERVIRLAPCPVLTVRA